MSETLDKTGYKKAADVSAKPLDGTIPMSADSWARGKLSKTFKTPTEISDVLNGKNLKADAAKLATPASDKPEARDAQGNKQQQQAQDQSQKDKKDQDEKFSAETNKPRDLKPDDAAIAPPRAAMAAIPAFAPKIAAGVLSRTAAKSFGADKEDKKPTYAVDDPSNPDVFKIGTAAARQYERKQAILEANDAEHRNRNNASELQQTYARQEQFNQYISEMNTYLDVQIDKQKNIIKDAQGQMAALDERYEVLSRERDGLTTVLQGERLNLAAVQGEITGIETEIADQKGTLTARKIEKAVIDKAIAEKEKERDSTGAQITSVANTEAELRQEAEEEKLKQGYTQEDMRMLQRSADQLQGRADALKAEIEAAQKKPLKDAEGRTIHSDEKGTLYAIDDKGQRAELTAAQQEALKEKQKNEDSKTPEQIQDMKKQAAFYQHRVNEMGKDKAADSKEVSATGEKRAELEKRADFYGNLRTELGIQFKEQGAQLEKLREQNTNLLKDIHVREEEIEKLARDLKEKKENEKTIQARIDNLQTEIDKKELEMKQNREEREKQELRVTQAKNDIDSMQKIQEKFKDPDFKKRLASGDPTARQEIQDLKDKMSPSVKKDIEEFEAKKKKELAINTPKGEALQTATPKTETASDVIPATNTSRASGTAAAAMDGQVVAGTDKQPTAQFNAVAVAPKEQVAEAPAPVQEEEYAPPPATRAASNTVSGARLGL